MATFATTTDLGTLVTGILQEAYDAGFYELATDISWVMAFAHGASHYYANGWHMPAAFTADGEGVGATESKPAKMNDLDVSIVEYKYNSATTGLAALTMPPEMRVGQLQAAGRAAMRQYVLLAISMLDGNTVGPDGKALGANDHPVAAGGTYDNLAGGSIGPAALETAMYALDMAPDERGVIYGNRATHLLTSRANKLVAQQCLGSGYQSNDLSKTTPQYLRDMQLAIIPEMATTGRWAVLNAQKTPFRMPIVKGSAPRQYFDQINEKHHILDSIYAGVGYIDWRAIVLGC